METDQTCVLPLLSVSVLLWQTVLLIAVPAFRNIALFLRKTSSLSEKKKITVYRYVLRESDWRSRYYTSPKKKDTQSDQRLGGKFCSSNASLSSIINILQRLFADCKSLYWRSFLLSRRNSNWKWPYNLNLHLFSWTADHVREPGTNNFLNMLLWRRMSSRSAFATISNQAGNNFLDICFL